MSQQARRERKVVTVLFADLVGFTSRAEELDPEDVEAILRPYHGQLRAELERHGGTVLGVRATWRDRMDGQGPEAAGRIRLKGHAAASVPL